MRQPDRSELGRRGDWKGMDGSPGEMADVAENWQRAQRPRRPAMCENALLGASYLDVLARMSEPSDASERLTSTAFRRSDASDILGITDVKQVLHSTVRSTLKDAETATW